MNFWRPIAPAGTTTEPQISQMTQITGGEPEAWSQFFCSGKIFCDPQP
jgi:hypothetical protein